MSCFAHDGSLKWRLAVTATPSAAIAVSAQGQVLIPSESGSLFVISAAGRLEREVAISDAPLADPVLDDARARVLVSTGDGQVAALSLQLAGINP